MGNTDGPCARKLRHPSYRFRRFLSCMKSRLEDDQSTFFALAFESPRLENDFVLRKGERLDCAFHGKKSRRVQLVGQGRGLCKKGPLPVSTLLRFDSTLARGADACGSTRLRAGSALSQDQL